jgi:hypothetical protein
MSHEAENDLSGEAARAVNDSLRLQNTVLAWIVAGLLLAILAVGAVCFRAVGRATLFVIPESFDATSAPRTRKVLFAPAVDSHSPARLTNATRRTGVSRGSWSDGRGISFHVLGGARLLVAGTTLNLRARAAMSRARSKRTSS